MGCHSRLILGALAVAFVVIVDAEECNFLEPLSCGAGRVCSPYSGQCETASADGEPPGGLCDLINSSDFINRTQNATPAEQIAIVCGYGCEEGYYCLPNEFPNKTVCPQGFFCPGSTSVPLPCNNSEVKSRLFNAEGNYCPGGIESTGPELMCPAGKYCVNEWEDPITCPEEHYCRPGTRNPKKCTLHYGIIGACKEGTAAPVRGLYVIISILVMIVFFGSLQLRSRMAVKQNPDKTEDEIVVAMAMLRQFTVENFEVNQEEKPKTAKLSTKIEFKNLSLYLRSNGRCVLAGVTGEFPPGSMVAVMGPSGAGKTTFLNTLTGKAHYGNVEGEIKVNGVPCNLSEMASEIGFVPQDDVVHDDISVRENLEYSARLRLPVQMPLAEKMKLVTNTLELLHCEHIQHSIVGSVEKRGISGGQRKRVNIGLELVANPRLLFLDEPTSGLDSTTTYQILESLNTITEKQGTTMAAVIHQPRYSAFLQFHQILLLGVGGRTVYLGPTSSVESYFTKLGYELPYGENPADFILDAIAGEAPNSDSSFTPDQLFEVWTKSKGVLADEELDMLTGHFASNDRVSPKGDANFFRVSNVSMAPVQEGVEPVHEGLKLKASAANEIQRRNTVAVEHNKLALKRQSMLSSALPDSTRRVVMKRFRDADVNHDGYVDAQELMDVLNAGGAQSSAITLKACQRLIKDAGGKEVNGEQVLTSEAFLTFILSKQEQKLQRHMTQNMQLEPVQKRQVAGFCGQFKTIFDREVVKTFNNRHYLFGEAVGQVFLGALIASLFGYKYSLVKDGVQVGFFTYNFSAMLSALLSVRYFGTEKLISYREASAGVSQAAYYAVKIFFNVVNCFFHSLLFLLLWYLMMRPRISFSLMYISLVLNAWAGSAFGIVFSLILGRGAYVPAGLTVALINSFLAGSAVPAFKDFSPAVKVFASVSSVRWLIPYFLIAEFDNGSDFEQQFLQKEMLTTLGYNLTVYAEYNTKREHDERISTAIGVLIGWGFALRIVGFLILKYYDREQKVSKLGCGTWLQQKLQGCGSGKDKNPNKRLVPASEADNPVEVNTHTSDQPL